jgi:hypothetical protein
VNIPTAKPEDFKKPHYEFIAAGIRFPDGAGATAEMIAVAAGQKLRA